MAVRKLSADMASRMADVAETMEKSPGQMSHVGSRRALSFARMVGAPEPFVWGATTYKLAPFPVARHPDVDKALSPPIILCLFALTDTTNEAGEYDYDQAADKIGSLLTLRDTDGNPTPITGDALYAWVESQIVSVSDADAAAMCHLAALAFERKHEGIQAETLLPDLDVPTFCQLIERISTLNPAFTSRF